MDIKFFWHLVNKYKSSKAQVHPIKLSNNQIICDPSEIRECWKEYFKSLYTPKDHESFDPVFKQHVENSVINMLADSYNVAPIHVFDKFEYGDIEKIVNGLKMKKAPGYDGIQPEHIRYGGAACIMVLKNLINSVCLSGYHGSSR